MIRKLPSGKYRLYSRKINPKTGKRRNLGTFDSCAAAEKHTRRAIFQTALNILPRESGGGGPREAWWRGLLTWRFVVVAENIVAAGAPSTTLLRRVVPLPRYRGAG